MYTYVDVSAAVHRRAGLGRYAESLARALAKIVPDQLALFYNNEGGIAPLAGLERLRASTINMGYKRWRMAVWLGQLARLNFNGLVPDADVFHATEHLLPSLPHIPTVLTVHDLIFRRLPQHHKRLNRWYLNLSMPVFCRRATRLIAVSEHTKSEVVAAYHIPPERISVIPEAPAPVFGPASPTAIEAVRGRFHLPQRYLLTVGTLEPRKNLPRLLEAWAPLYADQAAPRLVIAGKAGWLNDDFMAALERSPQRAGVVLSGYVPDTDLPALVGGAESFVFPSLYEGFGLPPLEAMACGVPVACSNSSSLPEVVGQAALLFDPLNIAAMRAAIERLSADADLRAELSRQGLERARQFSWASTARQTLGVYRLAQEAVR
jgi:glycosyltransferase involved in cell wall biosynthesis